MPVYRIEHHTIMEFVVLNNRKAEFATMFKT